MVKSKYPSLEDENFLQKFTKNFSKFKIPKKKYTMKEVCQPKKFKLQKSQELVSQYLSPSSPYKSLLVFHQIGSGKTCTAVSVAQQWIGKRQILVLVPASLIDNFRDELRSLCGGDDYLTEKERERLAVLRPGDDEYQEIIDKSNDRIDKYYRILSYHKFTSLSLENKINLKNTFLIIDEVQNMVSLSGTFYQVLSKMIQKAPDDLRIMLLSATPMFDAPLEIGLTLNLLRLKEPFPIGSKFNEKYINIKKSSSGKLTYSLKNMDEFRDKIKGYVSYYRGAPPVAYPEVEFKIVKAKMEEFQFKSYLGSLSDEEGYIRGAFTSEDILNLPKDFILGPRMISNIAFPNKKTGEEGFNSLKGNNLLLENLKDYSIKFYKIVKKLKQSEGPCFVYSNFKEEGGIASFIKVIEKQGWKDYRKYGEGKKRYAVWSGDETIKIKSEIKKVFNHPKNYDGSKLHLMLGSPSIKEGVTLLRVDQVHIIEPYWNMSRMLQIIGRAVRYCSHKDLPKDRRNVKIYLYLATAPTEYKENIDTLERDMIKRVSVDEYIWKLANKKDELINQFETALKEMAVDCKLFYNLNVFKEDEYQLQCFNEE
jgi:superfamily II DNA or RNA helicase